MCVEIIILLLYPDLPLAEWQMQSIFVSSTVDALLGVSGVSKDQKFHAKSDFGSMKRKYSVKIEKTQKMQ